jgi:hypothetical protein
MRATVDLSDEPPTTETCPQMLMSPILSDMRSIGQIQIKVTKAISAKSDAKYHSNRSSQQTQRTNIDTPANQRNKSPASGRRSVKHYNSEQEEPLGGSTMSDLVRFQHEVKQYEEERLFL